MIKGEDRKILLYTFYNWNAITYKLVRDLEIVDSWKLYIRGLSGSQKLAKHIINAEYKYVIGFGVFNKNVKRIKVEKFFINRYGRNKILVDEQENYVSTFPLTIPSNWYISEKTTTSQCNRSAYLSSNAIQRASLNTQITFVHIPSSYNLVQAKKEVTSYILHNI